MKYFRLLALVFVVMTWLSVQSHAQDRGFGLGIVLGEPTGLSGKYWLNDRTAIDGALAWSFYHGSSFHLHADYLIHSRNVFETQEPLLLYYGVGARLKSGDIINTQFGIRGVIGVEYLLRSAPIDLFLEVAPILDLTPATDLLFNAGIGARFFFN